jgi:chromosome partitioning protein
MLLEENMATNGDRHFCRTVMLFAPKGGVGKTTLAAHLLVSAAQAGLAVLGVDFDPQQTLKAWADLREANPRRSERTSFDVGAATLDDWQSVLEALDGYDLAVFDMPPGFQGFEARINALCAKVDLILIPTGHTAFDRRSVIPWMDRFADRGLKSAFAFNRTPQQHVISLRDGKIELMRHGPVVPVDIPLREDIHNATERGLTVVEVERAKARDEFRMLWEHVRREVRL